MPSIASVRHAQVERDEDQAGPHRPEIGRRQVGRRRRPGQQPVARLEPERAQPPGGEPRPAVEVAVRPARGRAVVEPEAERVLVAVCAATASSSRSSRVVRVRISVRASAIVRRAPARVVTNASDRPVTSTTDGRLPSNPPMTGSDAEPEPRGLRLRERSPPSCGDTGFGSRCSRRWPSSRSFRWARRACCSSSSSISARRSSTRRSEAGGSGRARVRARRFRRCGRSLASVLILGGLFARRGTGRSSGYRARSPSACVIVVWVWARVARASGRVHAASSWLGSAARSSKPSGAPSCQAGRESDRFERLTGPGGSAMLRQPWTGPPFGDVRAGWPRARRCTHDPWPGEVNRDWQKSEWVRTRRSKAPCVASTRRSSRAASSPRLAAASTTRSPL